ncbi:hypothetical protein G7Z17_g11015 [Cylindrodendrum hubeiense]|uniref:Uncharacterized protein n=1 Tax=Cylindrodendrum hubeiense TaxID=595255 RepID=A0A9P5LBR7_9HYPO|nr:hypothetical protein G7Z17_g11015 [Cylindrodendrum hubeiense]
MTSNRKTKEPFWLGSDEVVLKSKTSMLNVMYRFAVQDARFGLHSFLSEKVLKFTGESKISVSWNIACAGVAGGIAGVVGNPAEVALVRMCADGAKPQAQRFGYSNAVDALIRVSREEGLQAFGKGITANIARSVLMRLGDDIKTHAIASLAAGTMATTHCAPADVLKSRLQASAGKEVSFIPQSLNSNSHIKGTRDRASVWPSRGRCSIPHARVDARMAEVDAAYCFDICVYGEIATVDHIGAPLAASRRGLVAESGITLGAS